MTATHPCDTCGGSGGKITDPICNHGTGWSRECPRCLIAFRCPICLGAGRFPDRMPAADALADAETLTHYLYFSGRDSIRCGKASAALRVFGHKTHTTTFNDAPGWSVRDARAAFRAVPGLRG